MVSEGGSKDQAQENDNSSNSEVNELKEKETSFRPESVQANPGDGLANNESGVKAGLSSDNALQREVSEVANKTDTESIGDKTDSATQSRDSAAEEVKSDDPSSIKECDSSSAISPGPNEVVGEASEGPEKVESDNTSLNAAKAPSPMLPVYRENKPLFISCITIAVLLIARLLWAQILHPMRIGWDPALHLQAAQMIVDGAIPYVDVVDCNPPLIWYLDTIPAYLSKVLDFPVTQSFNFFLIFIITVSVSACIALFFTKGQRKDAWMFVPFILGLTLFNFFLRFDFGQREEIFVLFYMPFFVARWLTWQGCGVKSKFWGAVVGVLGALGICIKPYFLIPAGLVELYFLLEKRKVRPLITVETISCAVACVVYALHFLFVPASMRDYYFGFLVPSYAIGYSYWDVSLGGSFCDPVRRDVFFLNAIVCLLAVALRNRSSLLLPLAVFALAGDIVYLLQFKGWHYHDQPVYAASFILAWMEGFCLIIWAYGLICGLLQKLFKEKAKKLVLPRFVAPVVLVLLASWWAGSDGYEDYKNCVGEVHRFEHKLIGYKGNSPWSDVDTPYTQFVLDNRTNINEKILFISNGVTPGYPWLTQLRCAPASRHLHMVVLSVLQFIEDTRKGTAEYQRFRAETHRIVMEYVEDINKNKPVLIFLQIGPDYFDKPFDFINIYLQDYDEVKKIDNFRVFKRKVGR